jgi:AcrR family transcriptional regulator
MPNVDDLRYVRTETAIRETFMDLMGEKPVSAITASELCRRAGISRNAFYLHYASVPALYAILVNELVSDIRAEGLASVERRSATGRDDELNAAIVGALTQAYYGHCCQACSPQVLARIEAFVEQEPLAHGREQCSCVSSMDVDSCWSGSSVARPLTIGEQERVKDQT